MEFLCHRFLDFPEIKGIFPETKKAIKFDQISCCSKSPGGSAAGYPGTRVRLSKAGVGSHRPTPYVGHQADKGTHLPRGPKQRQWLRSPMGFEVGWYIFTLHQKPLKNIQTCMWGTTHITNPMGWYWEMEIDGNWTL